MEKSTIKYYGKHNFVLPTLDTIKRAMDSKLNDKEKKLLIPLSDNINDFHTLLYEPVKIPQKGEWLYEQKESGQTFKSYSGGMLSSPSRNINKVYINILNNKDSFIDQEVLDIFTLFINSYYPGLYCTIMKKHNSFEDLGIQPRENGYIQYNAGATIEKLKSFIPKDGIFIIGLTVMDIYPREEWNFCYGLADKMSGCGVFSIVRHYDESRSKYKDEKLIRLSAIYQTAYTLIHEIGHLLGLKHCTYYDCIIRGCNHSGEIFNKFYCPVCMCKLYWNLKFDIINYWNGLLALYEKLNQTYPGSVDNKIYWLIKRIKLLE